MKKFDKKLIIYIILLFIILGVSLYFFTKPEDYETIDASEFVATNSTNTVEKQHEIIIHIDGEVVNPGIVKLPENSRIADAIFIAGGTTEIADVSRVNLAYVLKDGQKIYIPSIYDKTDTEHVETDAGLNVIIPDYNSSSSSVVNINLATQDELDSLPGIGSSTASKIIDYRNKNGNFKSIHDITNVSGIGEAKFENIKDFICI